MTARTSSMLIIITMFLIGAVVGVLATSAFYQNRFQKIAQLRTCDGFVQTVEDVIQPKDSSQRKAVRQILTSTADSVIQNNAARRNRFSSLVNSMSIRIDPLLDSAQHSRLGVWVEEIHEHERRMERREQGK